MVSFWQMHLLLFLFIWIGLEPNKIPLAFHGLMRVEEEWRKEKHHNVSFEREKRSRQCFRMKDYSPHFVKSACLYRDPLFLSAFKKRPNALVIHELFFLCQT